MIPEIETTARDFSLAHEAVAIAWREAARGRLEHQINSLVRHNTDDTVAPAATRAALAERDRRDPQAAAREVGESYAKLAREAAAPATRQLFDKIARRSYAVQEVIRLRQVRPQ